MKTEDNHIPSDGNPVDILLVEDNAGDIRLTQEAFKDGRIINTLHVVKDGVDALDFIHQRGEYEDAPRPDLVLLDLNLPRKDGHEVLEELHADPETRRIAVIVLVSSDVEKEIVQSNDPCANGYLTKPVDPGDFIDTIRTLESYWLSVVRSPVDTDRN